MEMAWLGRRIHAFLLPKAYDTAAVSLANELPY
jgi:hypothetical protein